jgi:hypothetical protein
LLSVDVLLQLVDQKLAVLADKAREKNSPEARSEAQSLIACYRDLKGLAEAFRDVTIKYATGQETEEAVSQPAQNLRRWIYDWFEHKHVEIFDKTYDRVLKCVDVAILGCALNVCMSAGVGEPFAAIISGAIVGGSHFTDAIVATFKKKKE